MKYFQLQCSMKYFESTLKYGTKRIKKYLFTAKKLKISAIMSVFGVLMLCYEQQMDT